GSYLHAEQSVDGLGTPGIPFGIHYDPIPALSLSTSYRSNVRVHMEGNAVSAGRAGHSSTNFYVPHAVRAGFAYRALNDRLRLIGELRVQFHKDANVSQVFDIELDTGLDIQTIAPFNWKNVFIGSLGL